jgi:hypothetical protein
MILEEKMVNQKIYLIFVENVNFMFIKIEMLIIVMIVEFVLKVMIIIVLGLANVLEVIIYFLLMFFLLL